MRRCRGAVIRYLLVCRVNGGTLVEQKADHVRVAVLGRDDEARPPVLGKGPEGGGGTAQRDGQGPDGRRQGLALPRASLARYPGTGGSPSRGVSNLALALVPFTKAIQHIQ
jgi:hypothetical protein